MKLQLALDDLTLEAALALLDQVHLYVDIVEIGTPFMMAYGMEAVRTVKQRYSDCVVLCDAKIMDAGAYEARLCFAAGADYVTVLGVTDLLTIRDTVQEAKKWNGKIMVDMICVKEQKERVPQIEHLGVDIIAVHTGVDQQAAGKTPLDDLKEISAITKRAGVAVAGGINADTVQKYMGYHPEIIIVGGGISHRDDPVRAAKELAEKMKEEAKWV